MSTQEVEQLYPIKIYGAVTTNEIESMVSEVCEGMDNLEWALGLVRARKIKLRENNPERYSQRYFATNQTTIYLPWEMGERLSQACPCGERVDGVFPPLPARDAFYEKYHMTLTYPDSQGEVPESSKFRSSVEKSKVNRKGETYNVVNEYLPHLHISFMGSDVKTQRAMLNELPSILNNLVELFNFKYTLKSHVRQAYQGRPSVISATLLFADDTPTSVREWVYTLLSRRDIELSDGDKYLYFPLKVSWAYKPKAQNAKTYRR